MNVKLMVIGGILVLLLILLSPNPARDQRRAQEKAMEGKDKLVESIKEHNSGKTKFTWSSLMGGGSKPKATPTVSSGDLPAPAPAKTNPYLQPAPLPEAGASKVAVPASRPVSGTASSAPAKPPQPESYYPPPPLD